MGHTSIKLDEYDSKNLNHLSTGDISFSFTHPQANGINAKGLLLPSMAFGSKGSTISKVTKRKLPPFRPTELSTIFENLAY
jgi:hypothetical protein